MLWTIFWERVLLLSLIAALLVGGSYYLVKLEIRLQKSNAKNQKKELTPLGIVVTFAIIIGFFYLVAFILQLLAPISGIVFGFAALGILLFVGYAILIFGLGLLGWAYEIGGILGLLLAIYLIYLIVK
jgi:hypothetical protein